MAEFIQAANNLTWPGAVAILGICIAIVGVAFAFAWIMRA